MVAINTVKIEDGTVSCETPEGTVKNININQRPCMESRLDAIKNVRIVRKDEQCNQPARTSPSGVYLGGGVSLMSLGVFSLMLHIIFIAIPVDLNISYAGIHFWVGFPFFVAGVMHVVAYKYPDALLRLISLISLLACMAVSIAGMVFVVTEVSSGGNNMEYLCDNLGQRQNRDYNQTTPLRYYNRYYDRDYDLKRCKRGFQQYRNMRFAMVVMSLVMMIWGLCASTITLGYRLMVIFRAHRRKKEKADPLLSPNPTQDIIIALRGECVLLLQRLISFFKRV
ncbi:unnamed protein product [Staurois parvus]|uniref:Uncharacterized protein n=1 Tax=Staurois parvus TaxID=386267 RepID=A0ABN9BKA6_9NEOB|nr:unnamed protein product [Staurois parvus]